MNSIVGLKLRALRERKGLSQEQVAEYLHISQPTYARLESGQTNNWSNFIQPITNLYNIAPEELLRQDGVIIEKIESNGALYNSGTINLISEKLIEQYEARLKEKDNIIKILRKSS